MSIPPLPPPLEQLGNRPFSFYPAILGIEHNEWLFRKATWSEVLVVNVKTHEEIWIPRRFLGEISRIDDPVLIQGLLKELEYRAGVVLPHQRRLIEIPVAVGQRHTHAPAERPTPAQVIGIRLESRAESRVGRLILGTLVVGVLACVVVVMTSHEGPLRPRIVYTNKDHAFLELSNRDTYYSAVNKLGSPAEDHSTTKPGGLHFRVLWYPERSYFIVFMGAEPDQLRYIGAMDQDWNVVHSVSLPGGANSASMLRALKKF